MALQISPSTSITLINSWNALILLTLCPLSLSSMALSRLFHVMKNITLWNSSLTNSVFQYILSVGLAYSNIYGIINTTPWILFFIIYLDNLDCQVDTIDGTSDRIIDGWLLIVDWWLLIGDYKLFNAVWWLWIDNWWL